MQKAINAIKKTFVFISVIWTIITLGFIGFMVFSGPSSCSVDGVESETASEVTGEVPDFEFEEMDGETTFTNESISGTYTLLYFWGTSCGICINEIPHLQDAYTDLQSRDFQIIAVSYDEKEDNVREFIEEYPMPWKHTVVGSDSEKMQHTFNRFGVAGTPHKILISPEGEILENIEGFSGDELYDLIGDHLPAS